MLVELLTYLLVGSFAGILAGMFGVGGGIIIVPVLVFVFSILGFEDSYLVQYALNMSPQIIKKKTEKPRPEQ